MIIMHTQATCTYLRSRWQMPLLWMYATDCEHRIVRMRCIFIHAIHAHTHTYMYTHIHTFTHTYIHVHTHTYIHINSRT